MYKVVIVDDEPIIVEGLSRLLPWDKYGCEVVGKDGYTYFLVGCFCRFHYRLDESLVKVADGSELQFEVAVMTCLVGCLDVNKHEIVRFHRLYRCFCFALVIGVCKPCSPWNLDYFQSGILAYALYQVDGRDHAAALYLRKLLHEGLHGWPVAS